jgi:hypothetical protein
VFCLHVCMHGRVSFFLKARRALTLSYCYLLQFTCSVIVEQLLGLSPDDSVTGRLLQDYSTFMKGLASLPLNIPGTPYARAVKVR